jgi:hypothetical protein
MNTNEKKSTPWKAVEYGSEYQLECEGFVWGLAYGEESANKIINAVNNYEPMQQRIRELEECLEKLVSDNNMLIFPDFSKAESLLQSSKQL